LERAEKPQQEPFELVQAALNHLAVMVLELVVPTAVAAATELAVRQEQAL